MLNRNIGKFNLHILWNRVLLNTPGLKIKRHVHGIGHAQNTQYISPAPINQPNTPISLSQPNTPMQFFTGSMEHTQRTPLSEHAHRTFQNMYKLLNFISPSDLMKSSCGWMKACLIQHKFCSRESTNYLRIQQDEKSTHTQKKTAA